MGRDFRGFIQKWVGDRWEYLEIYRTPTQNYDLFGWLSWGRDRSGSCQLKALVPARGLPVDLDIVNGVLYVMDNGKECNVGEFGHSWLLGSEILQATPPKLVRTVVATPAALECYDFPDFPPWQVAINDFFEGEPGPPDKTISIGDNVEVSGAVLDYYFDEDDPNPPSRNFSVRERVVYQWLYDFEPEFRDFIRDIRRQVDMHGEIRLVFGFT